MSVTPTLRIFLVDDEPFCLDLYRQYLINLGQKDIQTFETPSACLDQLTSNPDLIFLDYRMDTVDGLEMLKKIKRFNPNALVAFISGQEEIGVAVNTLQYGALDYLTKSQVSEVTLGKVLGKAIHLKQLIDAKAKRSWLKKILPVFICTLLFLQLCSCTTQNLFQTRQESGLRDSCFQSVTVRYQYEVRTDDKISISIWGHDDLSVGSLYGIYNSNEVYGKWLLVNARGEINVPRVGIFHIGGLTVMQAEDSLRRLFGEWIRDPVIEVKVLNKEIVVLGEMKNPGKVLLEKDNNSLVEMIARAGDFDFYANKKDIRLIRTVGGEAKMLHVDLTRMDGYMVSNVRVIPGDVIYVPSKKSKDFEKRLSTIVPLVSIITGTAIAYKAFF